MAGSVFIVILDGRDCAIEDVGGKAINLSKMVGAGFSVPPAFAITAEAYDFFLHSTGLYDKIGREIETIDYDSSDSLAAVTAHIREMVASEKVPKDIMDEIESAVSSIGGTYYAVRSSAVAEDLADASFAGQQDTFLNVTSEKIAESTVLCWASYWNDRAVKYRHDAMVDHLSQGIAVAVQKMVASEISGVMFTADPINGSDDVVIESSWGLGESIASGIVTPDRFVTDREGNVKEFFVKSKEKGYYLVDGKNTLVTIPEDKVNARCADDEIISKVVKQGIALEKHFGVPQDVEWAIEGGNVYILQSRAVTTLTDESEKDGILWTRAYGDEYWADATTPLFYSTMGKMLTDYVNHEGAKMMGYKELTSGPLIRLHKTRVYFNTWVLERVFAHYPKFIRSKELLNYFPLKDQRRISEYPNDTYHTVMSQLLVMVRDPDGMMNHTDKAYKKWAEGFMKLCGEIDATDLTELSDGEIDKLYWDVEDASKKHYRLIRYGMVSHSIATNLMVKSWLASWIGDTDGSIYAELISGLPGNRTVATNIGFSQLGKIIRENPDIKQRSETMELNDFLKWMDTTDNPLKPAFDDFIKEYGHRSNTREIMVPRWSEDRAYVLNVAKQLSETDLDLKNLETVRRQDRERAEEKAIAEIRKMHGGPVRAKLFKIVLGLAQTYLIFRENQRFYLDHILLRQRIILREIGRRLCERSELDDGDDVFFLYEDEVFRYLRGENTEPIKKEVSDRKKEFYRYKQVLPPKFLKNGIDFDDTVVTSGENIVYGAASSPGTYTGVVHVIVDINDLSEVRDGEILVTSNTDPGWTAVFSRLGGLITETGGILSHGAVISREYRIPAVTAVKGATSVLRTGQKVTVDGNEGAVYILEEDQ